MNENNEIIEKNIEEEVLETSDIQTEISDKTITISKKKPKKPINKKKLIIISAIILGVLIILVLVYFIFFRKSKENTPKESVSVVANFDNYTYKDGILTLLSDKKEELGTYTCEDKNEKKCYVATISLDGRLDKAQYVNDKDEDILVTSKIYFDNFVFIYDDSNIILYDLKNKKTLGEYDEIFLGNIDNFVAVKSDDDYSILLFTENEVQTVLEDYEYLEIGDSSEIFLMSKSDALYLVNNKGKILSPKMNGIVKSFNSKYIAVFKDESYQLYNYSGSTALDETFDYIAFKDNYIITIKDMRLYVYDEDLAKYTIDGIKIKDLNYNVKYVFDSKNKLQETKKAYDINITEDNKMVITLSDESQKEINLYEGVINKRYDYVSYFDGKLYLYEDSKKTKLLGKYTCNYENEIKSSDDSFANCFIATESDILNKNQGGFAPFINNRFAFINDTKTGANKKIIYLYDVNENKTKSKYSAIDTGNANGNITSINLNDTLIYAKSYSDDSLGAISFNTTGVESAIAFRITQDSKTYLTTNISLFNNDYLLVKRENKNYLYTKNGKLVASSIYEVKVFNSPYLLVKNSGYILYKMASDGENGEIVSNELDYIELKNNYFVGIKNNKLNIYSYADGKKSILESDVTLETNDTNYQNYTVNITSDGFNITVSCEDGTKKEYNFDLTGREAV